MQASITGDPLAAHRADAWPERAATGRPRLWHSLTAAWMRRLDRRIEEDLRWLDHHGVAEDFRRASRG